MMEDGHTMGKCFAFVGPCMIVCLHGSCAAGCNQEPVQAIVAQVVFRYSNSLLL